MLELCLVFYSLPKLELPYCRFKRTTRYILSLVCFDLWLLYVEHNIYNNVRSDYQVKLLVETECNTSFNLV